MKSKREGSKREIEKKNMGGGGGWNKGSTVMATAATVMVMMMAVGEAEIDAGCAQSLVPCLDFLDSANPPLKCCNPLQEMVINDLSCLCYLYANTDFLQTYGLNRTISVRLVRRCGLTVSFASCQASSAPPPTQATLSQATPGADGGDAGRVPSTIGLSLVLLFCSAMLFR
ncbi:lipid transfer-like protein VAS [Neltuma alba]|uniref:lipid transfer-like protein VAS n=1 Tax=Neltuma alba TaxID=207710 RepID=UPI0010A35942|nr:lipid transfer-like protein VAS [Prosopis alba]